VVLLPGRARAKIDDCKSFIRKYGKAFHPNHYLLTDIQMMPCLTLAVAATKSGKQAVIPGKHSFLSHFYFDITSLMIFFRILSNFRKRTQREGIRVIETAYFGGRNLPWYYYNYDLQRLFFLFPVDQFCLGLSQLSGNLLINLIAAQLTRLRKDFEGVKKFQMVQIPNSRYLIS